MKAATEDRWRAHVKAWSASGQTCKEYAARAGINARTLTWWKSKLAAAGPAPSFVEVTGLGPPTAARGQPPDSPAVAGGLNMLRGGPTERSAKGRQARRKDALLMVTLISNSVDEGGGGLSSKGTPDEWAQAVLDAKQGVAESIVVLNIGVNEPECGYGGAVTVRHMITPTMARVADMMTSTRSNGSSMS